MITKDQNWHMKPDWSLKRGDNDNSRAGFGKFLVDLIIWRVGWAEMGILGVFGSGWDMDQKEIVDSGVNGEVKKKEKLVEKYE